MYLIMLMLMIISILWKFNNSMINFLITMEYFVMTMIFMLIYNNTNEWIFMIYMIFSVCEAILGLSLMVSLNFNFGHQKINTMNLCAN